MARFRFEVEVAFFLWWYFGTSETQELALRQPLVELLLISLSC